MIKIIQFISNYFSSKENLRNDNKYLASPESSPRQLPPHSFSKYPIAILRKFLYLFHLSICHRKLGESHASRALLNRSTIANTRYR